MGVLDNNFSYLERQRRELEGNILKLQECLYHWRTWEAEYDGLKDEISDLDDTATTDEFLRIGRDFGGSVVNEEEMKAILGAKQGITRSKEQAVNLISRRIDYVTENVRTMEKRLRTAEGQLHALDSVGQAPLEFGGDFPMTEIMEELDEEGNMVSTSMQTPGSQAPELLDILKRAGVKDIPDIPEQDTKEDRKASWSANVEDVTEEDTQTDEKPKWQETSATEDSTTSASRKSSQTPQPSQAPQERQADVQEPTLVPAESHPEPPKERPVTDVDEPPEDAMLRREMLEYGLNEVGSVVAELELDENASDVDLGSQGSYDDFDEEEEEDDDEDEFGRSTRPALSDDYHKQMRELEEKLSARGMWNVGKETGALPTEMKQDLARPKVVEIEGDKKPDVPVPGKGKQKKKVAFAEDLDIAPEPEPAPEKKSLPPQQSDVPAISDSIVERAEPPAKTSVTTEPPKKVSRFKSARSEMGKNTTPSEVATPAPAPTPSRQPPEVRSTRKTDSPSSANPPSSLPLFPAKPAEPKPFSQPISDVFELEKQPAPQSQPQPQPQPPENKISADKLVERDIPEGKATAPEPDELDEQLHKREIASEFYRMRNRMVQQNGGFVDDEPEIVPLETEDAPKKVSKFKAARMR